MLSATDGKEYTKQDIDHIKAQLEAITDTAGDKVFTVKIEEGYIFYDLQISSGTFINTVVLPKKTGIA